MPAPGEPYRVYPASKAMFAGVVLASPVADTVSNCGLSNAWAGFVLGKTQVAAATEQCSYPWAEMCCFARLQRTTLTTATRAASTAAGQASTEWMLLRGTPLLSTDWGRLGDTHVASVMSRLC